MIVINFGKFLKEKREENGVSMRELEKRSKISQSYISQVESGKRETPKPGTLKKIADGLGISYESLMIAAGYIESSWAQHLIKLAHNIQNQSLSEKIDEINYDELDPIEATFIVNALDLLKRSDKDDIVSLNSLLHMINNLEEIRDEPTVTSDDLDNYVNDNLNELKSIIEKRKQKN